MKTKEEFKVTEETKFDNKTKYDHIEWGEWWAEVYPNNSVQVLHQHGGDDWMRFYHDELPGLIALLIMIYTRSYK